MRFEPTPLRDAAVIVQDQIDDERGQFARFWSHTEYVANGIDFMPTACNGSYNRITYTLRGMHFQREPHAQGKLVMCTRGRIYDVIADIRPSSPTYGEWLGVQLSRDERKCLYVPRGFAHGFMTLEDDSEVLYFVSSEYHPSSAGGFRWNDPSFGIDWPAAPALMNDRDRTYADFELRH